MASRLLRDNNHDIEMQCMKNKMKFISGSGICGIYIGIDLQTSVSLNLINILQ